VIVEEPGKIVNSSVEREDREVTVVKECRLLSPCIDII
jgi:hypothetical protein